MLRATILFFFLSEHFRLKDRSNPHVNPRLNSGLNSGPDSATVAVARPNLTSGVGDAIGDGRGKAGASEGCSCCRGESAYLRYAPADADGLGYTYCWIRR